MRLGRAPGKLQFPAYVVNREGREVTRREKEKMELEKVENRETETRIGPLTSDLSPLTSS